MRLWNWDQASIRRLGSLVSRRTIHSPGLTILHVNLCKGAIIPAHRHFNEQVTMLTAGSLRVVIDGEEIIVHAGDVLWIQPNALHLAEALEDSNAIEIFAPAKRGSEVFRGCVPW
jgi:quercetin dioxygenase-like cupin family protein